MMSKAYQTKKTLKPVLNLKHFQRCMNWTFCGGRLRNILMVLLVLMFCLLSLASFGDANYNTTELAATESGDEYLQLNLVSWWQVLLHSGIWWLLWVLYLSRCPWLLFRTPLLSFESVVVCINTVLLQVAIVGNKVAIAREIDVPIAQWAPEVFRVVFV